MNSFPDVNKKTPQFRAILSRLAQKSHDCTNFSGLGFILYNSDKFDHSTHASLRPSMKAPEINLWKGNGLLLTLLEIADGSNTLHDGFHFFDYRTGMLTHIAQYFVPKVVPELKINEKYGTRYHSAMYGSCLEGVVLTGTVNCDRNFYVFEKGKVIN